MTDSLLNTLCLILSVIALCELVRNNIINCLVMLGVTGAVFIGMALKNHDGKSLLIFLLFILVYIVFFVAAHIETD